MNTSHRVLFFLLFYSFCFVARGQHPCESPGDQGFRELTSPNSRHEYRVIVENVESTIQYPISAAAFVQATIQAADVWNDHAHGGTLLYRGIQATFPAYPGSAGNPNGVADPWGTNGTYILPPTAAECDSLGLTESIVRVTGFPLAEPGSMASRCGGRQFEIRIFYREVLGTFAKRLFISEYPTVSTDHDLISTLTHEFGHALGLGHTTGGGESTMSPAALGSTRRRELYRWDTDCITDLFGERSITGTRRYYRSPITDVAFTSANITKAASGVSFSTGGLRRVASFKRYNCWAFEKNVLSPSPVCTNGISPYVTATTSAVYQDFAVGIDRVHYPSREGYVAGWLQEDSYATTSVRRLRYTRSSDGFTTTLGNGGVNACTSMSAWMTCSGQAHAFSNHPPAVAWDPQQSLTVTAWTNHNRLTNTEEREIRISAGVIGDTTLPQPWSGGRRSDIPPAVACRPGTGYNCLLAYVDPGDSLNRLRIQRFRNTTGCGYRYCYDPESSYHELAMWPEFVQTASRVALWYDNNDGYFRAAVRVSQPGQLLKVYRSTSGVDMSWSLEHTGVPSASGSAGPSTYTGGGSFLTYAN